MHEADVNLSLSRSIESMRQQKAGSIRWQRREGQGPSGGDVRVADAGGIEGRLKVERERLWVAFSHVRCTNIGPFHRSSRVSRQNTSARHTGVSSDQSRPSSTATFLSSPLPNISSSYI